MTPNQRAGGDGGIARLLHFDHARPAASQHDRWTASSLIESA